MRTTARVVSLLAALATQACRSGPPRPAAIEAGDMCTACKMAISEKRFAAQFIDSAGNAVKFDDIGCMVRFVRDRGLQGAVAAYFVADYDTRAWLDASEAAFVRSESNHTPMSSGWLAVSTRARGEEFGLRVMRFEDLWTSPQ